MGDLVAGIFAALLVFALIFNVMSANNKCHDLYADTLKPHETVHWSSAKGGCVVDETYKVVK